jgi:hypothetical protein
MSEDIANMVDEIFSDKDEINMRIMERAQEIKSKLDSAGFVKRPYRAEYSNFRQAVLITRPDDSKIWIDAIDIPKVLSGEIGLSDDDLRELINWHEISAFKKGTEIDAFNKRLKSLSIDDPEGLVALEEEVKVSGCLENDDDRGKRLDAQLAYLYNETDPQRIELLKTILYPKPNTDVVDE